MNSCENHGEKNDAVADFSPVNYLSTIATSAMTPRGV
jgi:hypothetical protein